MDYRPEDVGPALRRLRKAAKLQQKQVAGAIQRSGANVSRIERPGSNPKLASLLRYLEAIGGDLGELHRELRVQPADDPLEDAVARVDQRIREDPTFRQLARGMLERFGGPEPPPALAALADLIDRQGDQLEQQAEVVRRQEEQMAEVEGRLGKLEGQPAGVPPEGGKQTAGGEPPVDGS